jgi:peptidoglycan/LPS O-acetylase OafA/YrhL
MYAFGAFGLLLAAAVLLVYLIGRPRRRKGEPFDWSHRRRWWRPRWAFPDDR